MDGGTKMKVCATEIRFVWGLVFLDARGVEKWRFRGGFCVYVEDSALTAKIGGGEGVDGRCDGGLLTEVKRKNEG